MPVEMLQVQKSIRILSRDVSFLRSICRSENNVRGTSMSGGVCATICWQQSWTQNSCLMVLFAARIVFQSRPESMDLVLLLTKTPGERSQKNQIIVP